MRYVLVLSLALHALPGDRWFAPDKLKHFALSAFIQSVGYSGLRATGLRHSAALGGASAATAVFGVGKELHDRRTAEGFSIKDLSWDAAGALAASAVLNQSRKE